MKRTLAFCLACLLMLSAVPFTAAAQTGAADGAIYMVDMSSAALNNDGEQGQVQCLEFVAGTVEKDREYTWSFDYYVDGSTAVRMFDAQSTWGKSRPAVTFDSSEMLLPGGGSFTKTFTVGSNGKFQPAFRQRWTDASYSKLYVYNMKLIDTATGENVIEGVDLTELGNKNEFTIVNTIPNNFSSAIEDRVYRLAFSQYDWADNDYQSYIIRWLSISGIKRDMNLTLSFDYFLASEGSASLYNPYQAWNASQPGSTIKGSLTEERGTFSYSFTSCENDEKKGNKIGVALQTSIENGLPDIYIWNFRLTKEGSDQNLMTDTTVSWSNTEYVEIMPKSFDTSLLARVSAPTLSSIAINKAPAMTEYEIGDALNTTGLEILEFYNDGSTQVARNGYTVSGFDSETAGNKTVTVTHGGKTTTFDVTVNEQTDLSSIQVGSNPLKTKYILGEALDTAGLVLTLNCSDGSVRTANGGYTVSGFDSDTIGNKTLTVTYRGLTTSFDVTVEDYEKPVTENTAHLYNPQSGGFDTEAETMRQEILSTPDTLKASLLCKTYYISYRGNDANNGTSKDTPWRTIANLSNTTLRSGDVVLFERGGVYRSVGISTVKGVGYGAYGTGAKPQLLGSDKNYADEAYWEPTKIENVWRTKVPDETAFAKSRNRIEDIGNIVFDHGEICASDYKELKLTKLNRDYSFYHDAEEDYVYLYLSKGNPGALHESIEMCHHAPIFFSKYANNTFENLCIKYTGGHGISCSGNDGLTVHGCEIGYIGGSLLSDHARYGNGVEFYGDCDNCVVENCWIYQCYDAGYTNQGSGCYQENIIVRDNLMEYSPYNIEVWTDKVATNGGMKGCQFTDNILRFAGYGFGANNRYGSNTSAIGNISLYNYVVPSDANTIITRNIFDCSYRYVISVAYPNDAIDATTGMARGPIVTGNHWAQKTFSNSDTTACVGQTMFDGKKVYNCTTQSQMQTSVAVFDTAPASVKLIPILTSVSVQTLPSKVSYEIGETLDTTGLILKLNYSDGTYQTINSGYTTSALDTSVNGTKRVTVLYKGFSTSFSVTVIRRLASVAVSTMPTKQTYEIGETLSTAGLSLKLTYNDKTTQTVTSGYTVTGFNSATGGKKTVTVSYGGLTTTFDVTVIKRLKSLEVAQMPKKTVYLVGDAFDASGLVLKAIYNDGTSELITSDYSVSGWDSSSAGNRLLTIQYAGQETLLFVTVRKVKMVTIIAEPHKLDYQAGEKLDTTGLQLTVTYSDGVTEKLTRGFTVSDVDTTCAGTRLVWVSYLGVEDCYLITVQGPQITTQPKSVVVANGQNFTVSFKATGNGLTYKWYFKDKGAAAFRHTATFTGNSYYTQMNADRAGRQIYCVVTDRYGNTARTNTVTLGMKASITTQPKSIIAANGQNFTVSFKAVGDGLTYKWYFKDKGAAAFKHTATFTGNSYSTQMNTDRAGRQIYCVVTDKYGSSVKTNTVTLGMKVSITTQPKSITVANGQNFEISFKAAGDGLTYKWYYKDKGATAFKHTATFTGNRYSALMNADRAGRQIYCVVTDKHGNSVKTNTVTLNMKASIVTQPKSIVVSNGQNFTVSFKAAGDGLTYKWYYKDKGATAFKHTATFAGNSYYTQMNADRAGRQIYCVVTDKYGNSAKTNTVTLGMKATITTQPKSIVVPNGYNFTVSFKAVGDGLKYQWYYKDKGATAFKHTATFAGNSYYTQMNTDRAGRQIYCVVTDKYGNSIKTNTVILGMKATIIKNPNSTAVKKGVRANFKIAAVGDGLSYQWQVKTPSATAWKSVTITGYKTNTITVEATAARNGYQYRCAVTDQYGNKVYSAAAKLTVK